VKTFAIVFLCCVASAMGQTLPPLPTTEEPKKLLLTGKAASTFNSVPMALPEKIEWAWNKVNDVNVVGYWMFTNEVRLAFATQTNFVMDLPIGTNRYAVNSTNRFGLESALSKFVVWPPLPETNVFTLSASVTNWRAISWTNPPTTPATRSAFFKVVYVTNSASVVTSPDPRGPWSAFGNWTAFLTTNRAIGLRMSKTKLE
jgi:hypothetical protein